MRRTILLLIAVISTMTVIGQSIERIVPEQCGTMQHLQLQFERNPALKQAFEEQRSEFNRMMRQGGYRASDLKTQDQGMSRAVYTVPVVFHVVLTNPNVVTAAQIQAALDTLNKDFSGANGDSVRIPSYFKSLFGKSAIQFCLAQRTPAGEATSGIDRVSTTQTSFSTNDAVKSSSSGGANAWNPDKYLNIWLCILSNNILGYSTFPGVGAANVQGVVVDYRSLPGGSITSYNTGKTLTHETGHYFNLYHIWGDDNGACTGTDYVDDTPNQSNSTSGAPTGIVTDNCTTAGGGIMYQNYMDYTNDVRLVMFTRQQVERMESAMSVYRLSLLSSDGCQPPVQRNYDAELVSITQPAQRLCTDTYTPVVTIKNKGNQTLTSLNINTVVDDGNVTTFNWTGSLVKSASATITLKNASAAIGKHRLTVFVTNPDNNVDEDNSTDTVSLAFEYFTPVKTVSESFESTTFLPAGWDVINPGNGSTWKWVTGVAKTGTASVMIDNFDNSATGEKDDLLLPTVNLSNVDSAYLSFQVAAATSTSSSATNNAWDTLDVLVSTDCGQTYSSLYKKYGSSLVTRTTATTSAFTPTANEWRKDSINLINYLDAGNILIAIRNTNGYENNIYLDDINIRTVTINPNLKRQGFLVTPNPTNGIFAVQFYPPPANLRAIQVYNLIGQKIAEIDIQGQGGNYYSFDISNHAAGTYITRAVLTDRVITKKIVKL